MSFQDDDLLTPSLQARSEPSLDKPWGLGSQVWVAFFGGVLAVTFFAYLNGRRLRMSRKRLWQMIALGTVALLLTLAIAFYLGYSVPPGESLSDRTSIMRIVGRAIALLTYLGLRHLQRLSDRLYRFRHGAKYDSAWGPAIAVTLGLGLIQALIMSWVITLGARS